MFSYSLLAQIFLIINNAIEWISLIFLILIVILFNFLRYYFFSFYITKICCVDVSGLIIWLCEVFYFDNIVIKLSIHSLRSSELNLNVSIIAIIIWALKWFFQIYCREFFNVDWFRFQDFLFVQTFLSQVNALIFLVPNRFNHWVEMFFDEILSTSTFDRKHWNIVSFFNLLFFFHSRQKILIFFIFFLIL